MARRSKPRTWVPTPTDGRKLATRPSLPLHGTSVSTAHSGCSSTGANSTTCSSSSASRTSLTTSAPGWGTSSTSSTRGEARRRNRQAERSTNGRVWKMVLDPDDPTIVTSLTVLVEGDDNPVKTLDEIHQPDNLETMATGLLVTEDPGSASSSLPRGVDPQRDDGAALVRPVRRHAAGRREGGPVGRRRPDRCRAGTHDQPLHRELGRMGDDRDRGRLCGLRSRRVLDQRPGAHAVGGEGAG